MNHPWSDEVREGVIRPWENIPDNSLQERLVGETETEPDETREPRDIETIIKGCPYKYKCAPVILHLFMERFPSTRDFIIWVGRFICRLKLEALEKIIRLDISSLCRIANRANKDLQKKG